MFTGYNILNLDYLVKELDEDRVKSILFDFSSINKDVEEFLKYKAIDFSKQSLSKTHLIITSYKNKPVIAGYYTLSNKMIIIKEGALSKSLKKRIIKFANYDSKLKEYTLSAPLIAQLGKNFNYKNLITGKDLLEISVRQVKALSVYWWKSSLS